jgi:hypothetical protein
MEKLMSYSKPFSVGNYFNDFIGKVGKLWQEMPNSEPSYSCINLFINFVKFVWERWKNCYQSMTNLALTTLMESYRGL